MRSILLFIIFLASSVYAIGQTTVRGKVTDTNGEALIGVTVVDKNNPSNGAATDLDGNYSVTFNDDKPCVLVITFIGFKTITDTIVPGKVNVIVQNYVMKSSTVEVKEVEISATAVKAADYYMENLKKKSSSTIDYVSSESMRKTGDNNVSSAIARITGVSTNSGGFITVRGIGDRYVKTTINGSAIPTLDPFTSNIKLDFIPANLVDNVIITKTASPDLPGNWAGAYISVETKDYPEKFSVAVETQVGYNNQSTFKNVLTSEGSPTDWLGYDDGFRDREHNHLTYINRPTQFQELCALGLTDYYASLGVTSSWDAGSEAGINYFKLGLVQLGLLGAALINDPVAYNQAVAIYNQENALEAFEIINAAIPDYGKSFPNNWLPDTKKAPLNFSQSFGVGNQMKLGKNDVLGYLIGFRYGSSVSFDPDGSANRIEVRNTEEQLLYNSSQEFSKENNGWSGLVNLAYKFSANNSLSVLFMPNMNGTNNTRKTNQSKLIDFPGLSATVYDQFYEERKQFVYQLKSENYLPALKLKYEVQASYTDGQSDIPDFKTMNILDLNGQLLAGVGGINRYYRYLDENTLDSRVKFSFPIGDKPGLSRTVSFGASYQYQDRDFRQYSYTLGATDSSGNILSGSYFIPNNDLEAFLSDEEFEMDAYTFQGYPRRRVKKFYYDDENPANHTFGNSEISGAFAMIDYNISFLWRISAGLRVEQVDIFTDVYEYDKLGYAPNDFRRQFEGDIFAPNPANFTATKFLPSINVIYKLADDEKRATNLRLNYSKSTAYPSIRELSEPSVLDFELRSFVAGNSALKAVDIDNYDLRWETYFKSGNNISISAFYKDFKNHIELLNSVSGVTWQNVNNSYVVGVELEGRRNITTHLEFKANVALINSETNSVYKSIVIVDGIRTVVEGEPLKRKMFGQAPYVVNAMLSYNFDKPQITITGSYNIQGKRLVIASDELTPFVYELPRNVVDIKMTKKFGSHFVLAITVRDLLNEPITREYDNKVGDKVVYDKLRWGTNYNVGLTYRL